MADSSDNTSEQPSNAVLHTLKAYAQAKAAGEHHELAMAIPHGFRADPDYKREHYAELDYEKAMWHKQHASAAQATWAFLQEHKQREQEAKQAERDALHAKMAARSGKLWGKGKPASVQGTPDVGAGISIHVVRR